MSIIDLAAILLQYSVLWELSYWTYMASHTTGGGGHCTLHNPVILFLNVMWAINICIFAEELSWNTWTWTIWLYVCVWPAWCDLEHFASTAVFWRALAGNHRKFEDDKKKKNIQWAQMSTHMSSSKCLKTCNLLTYSTQSRTFMHIQRHFTMMCTLFWVV